MGNNKSGESIIDFRMGPAFFAVIIQTAIAVIGFVYIYGQQVSTNENTKKVTDKLEMAISKQEDKQSNQIERLVKVETIVSTMQSGIMSIESKIDRLAAGGKLDKN